MLRIHVERNHEEVTLRLEGKLVQPWVDELIRAWNDLAGDSHPGRTARIDLGAVSFVDTQGRAVLATLQRLGCQLNGASPFIAALIEEATADPTH